MDAGVARPGPHVAPPLPLVDLHIIDLTGGDAESCGRYLADLGAAVIKVEPPGGSTGRRDPMGFAAPVLPPPGLAGQTVAAHAAWAALVAYVQRLRTGTGQQAGVSALEAVIHGFDPGFGVQGPAAAGNPARLPRDRPDAAHQYPVFGCADRQVRICVLSGRQWRAMFEWLGEPAEFADPRYDATPARFEATGRLHPLIAALFADRARDELVAEGAKRGIPVAGMLTAPEVLAPITSLRPALWSTPRSATASATGRPARAGVAPERRDPARDPYQRPAAHPFAPRPVGTERAAVRDDDPHLAARQSFRTLTHPLLACPSPSGAPVARFSGIADPPLRPAPMPGEHTRDIARTLLGLNDAEIDRLPPPACSSCQTAPCQTAPGAAPIR